MPSSKQRLSADVNLKNAKLGLPGGGGKPSGASLVPGRPGKGPQRTKNGEQLLFSLLPEIVLNSVHTPL